MENFKKFAALAVFILLTLVIFKFIWWILVIVIWLIAGWLCWALTRGWLKQLEGLYSIKKEEEPVVVKKTAKCKTSNRKTNRRTAK